MNRSITLQSPAKVNFRLDVLKKRADGYHELRMIMQRIALCDELRLSIGGKSGILLTCDGPPYIPRDMSNIACKAARAILNEAAIDVGVQIHLIKRIPVAAGLGGGSSNAASVLEGLNELLQLGYSSASLQQMALQLGADVPFFIFKGPAVAEGIGEKLTLLEQMPRLWLLLVNPAIHISTAWAYGNLNLTTDKVAAKLPFLYKSAADVRAILSNDLEEVAMARHPLLREIKEQLVEAGAYGALMSGSGSTLFGLFADAESAHEALARFPTRAGWFTAVVPTI